MPVFSDEFGLIAVGLAVLGNQEVYLRDQSNIIECARQLNQSLSIDRPLTLYVLPRELAAMRPPIMAHGGGLLVIANPSDPFSMIRILQGIALTHADLPQDDSLLSTLIRYGMASRFMIYYFDSKKLSGLSPFVFYDQEEINKRLLALLTFVLHYGNEPSSSFRDGWLSEQDLELLGWLATNQFKNWPILGKERIPIELVPASGEQAPLLAKHVVTPTARALRNMAWSQIKALIQDLTLHKEQAQTDHLLGDEFSLSFATSRGPVEGRSMLMITHKQGVSLLRYSKGASQHYAAVDLHALKNLLAELESLGISNMSSQNAVSRFDVPLYSLAIDSRYTKLGLDFYGPLRDQTPHAKLNQIINGFLHGFGL
jgi:hypothetical protein